MDRIITINWNIPAKKDEIDGTTSLSDAEGEIMRACGAWNKWWLKEQAPKKKRKKKWNK